MGPRLRDDKVEYEILKIKILELETKLKEKRYLRIKRRNDLKRTQSSSSSSTSKGDEEPSGASNAPLTFQMSNDLSRRAKGKRDVAGLYSEPEAISKGNSDNSMCSNTSGKKPNGSKVDECQVTTGNDDPPSNNPNISFHDMSTGTKVDLPPPQSKVRASSGPKSTPASDTKKRLSSAIQSPDFKTIPESYNEKPQGTSKKLVENFRSPSKASQASPRDELLADDQEERIVQPSEIWYHQEQTVGKKIEAVDEAVNKQKSWRNRFPKLQILTKNVFTDRHGGNPTEVANRGDTDTGKAQPERPADRIAGAPAGEHENPERRPVGSPFISAQRNFSQRHIPRLEDPDQVRDVRTPMGSTIYLLNSEDAGTPSILEAWILRRSVETGSWATATTNLLLIDDFELQKVVERFHKKGLLVWRLFSLLSHSQQQHINVLLSKRHAQNNIAKPLAWTLQTLESFPKRSRNDKVSSIQIIIGGRPSSDAYGNVERLIGHEEHWDRGRARQRRQSRYMHPVSPGPPPAPVPSTPPRLSYAPDRFQSGAARFGSQIQSTHVDRAEQSQGLFGHTPAHPIQQRQSLFGNFRPNAFQESQNLFGPTPAQHVQPSQNLFNPTPALPKQQQQSLFGNVPAQRERQSQNLFGNIPVMRPRRARLPGGLRKRRRDTSLSSPEASRIPDESFGERSRTPPRIRLGRRSRSRKAPTRKKRQTSSSSSPEASRILDGSLKLVSRDRFRLRLSRSSSPRADDDMEYNDRDRGRRLGIIINNHQLSNSKTSSSSSPSRRSSPIPSPQLPSQQSQPTVEPEISIDNLMSKWTIFGGQK